MQLDLEATVAQACVMIAGAKRVELVIQDGEPARLITEHRRDDKVDVRVYVQNRTTTKFVRQGNWTT